jgi:predicted CXXCH cytochrome family protein
MRTLKLALAATAAIAFNANAQGVHGMGNPPTGAYQNINQLGLTGQFMDVNGIAFHAGGAAPCDGCHVMHNAAGGVAKSTNNGAGEPAWSNHSNAYLLQGSDQSSTCLICHGSATQKSGSGNQFVVADLSGLTPSYRSPGGDFGWLQKSWTALGATGAASDGAAHGHNVQAKDFGWLTDSRFTQGVAPGGTFTITGGNDLASFACSSCHDPHGRYRMQTGGTLNGGVQFAGPFSSSVATLPIAVSGSYGDMPTGTYAVGSYRLLAGKSYTPASKPGFPFPNDPPVAVAPRDYNRSETGATGASEVRVQYGTGMSEWCKNCHSEIHSEGYVSGFGGQRHPAAKDAYLKPTQYNIYNTYVSSGVYQGGATLYTSLVPFEQGTSPSLTALQTAANAGAAPTAGATSAVMCLSCHRAHASAFDSMVRWDQNATFLTDSGTGFTQGLSNRSTTETAAGYYDRQVQAAGNGSTIMGPFQRSFCNKCHGKD